MIDPDKLNYEQIPDNTCVFYSTSHSILIFYFQKNNINKYNKSKNKIVKFFVLLGLFSLSITLVVGYDPIFASHSGTHHEENKHSTEGHKKTIFIGPELADCVGVGPQKCNDGKRLSRSRLAVFL